MAGSSRLSGNGVDIFSLLVAAACYTADSARAMRKCYATCTVSASARDNEMFTFTMLSLYIQYPRSILKPRFLKK
jgi:hypothetical protein